MFFCKCATGKLKELLFYFFFINYEPEQGRIERSIREERKVPNRAKGGMHQKRLETTDVDDTVALYALTDALYSSPSLLLQLL